MIIMEYIDLSAKTLALFHIGAIKLKCSTCLRQVELNCFMDNDKDAEYYNPHLGTIPFCPVRLITDDDIIDWYDEHIYNTEYHTSPDYDDADYYKWTFIKLYKKYLIDCEKTDDVIHDDSKKKEMFSKFKSISTRE